MERRKIKHEQEKEKEKEKEHKRFLVLAHLFKLLQKIKSQRKKHVKLCYPHLFHFKFTVTKKERRASE